MNLLSNEAATPTTRRIRIAVGERPFSYRAGQSASLAAGTLEPTPYSLASAPFETAQQGWLEFLIKVDGSSRFGAVVDRLQPGTDIAVHGPAGNFVLPELSSDVSLLFIAGGTGIAPMRSLILQAAHARHSNISLLYSARTPDEFAYWQELRQLAEATPFSMMLTLTGEHPEWEHERGRTGAGHLSRLVTPGTVAFVCGPPAMVEEVPLTLASLGVPRERVRTEDW